MRTPSIHKSLNLPSGYRAKTSITGCIRIGDSFHEQKLIELRFMTTDTHGQEAVYAVLVVHDSKGWMEINGKEFNRLATAVITGEQLHGNVWWSQEVAS